MILKFLSLIKGSNREMLLQCGKLINIVNQSMEVTIIKIPQTRLSIFIRTEISRLKLQISKLFYYSIDFVVNSSESRH